ncbi:MAG: hypothetical protein ACTSYD_12405 [Candidatus Heimdallarchaeaceae archaeon]
MVEYALNNSILGPDVFKEAEVRFDDGRDKGYIDVLKWVFQDNGMIIAAFEVKPIITDLGGTLRQIKRYSYILQNNKIPKLGPLAKRIITYLVVSNDKRNYALLDTHQQTFKHSGINFLLFVNIEKKSHFLLPVLNFSEDDLKRLKRWLG